MSKYIKEFYLYYLNDINEKKRINIIDTNGINILTNNEARLPKYDKKYLRKSSLEEYLAYFHSKLEGIRASAFTNIIYNIDDDVYNDDIVASYAIYRDIYTKYIHCLSFINNTSVDRIPETTEKIEDLYNMHTLTNSDKIYSITGMTYEEIVQSINNHIYPRFIVNHRVFGKLTAIVIDYDVDAYYTADDHSITCMFVPYTIHNVAKPDFAISNKTEDIYGLDVGLSSMYGEYGSSSIYLYINSCSRNPITIGRTGLISSKVMENMYNDLKCGFLAGFDDHFIDSLELFTKEFGANTYGPVGEAGIPNGASTASNPIFYMWGKFHILSCEEMNVSNLTFDTNVIEGVESTYTKYKFFYDENNKSYRDDVNHVNPLYQLIPPFNTTHQGELVRLIDIYPLYTRNLQTRYSEISSIPVIGKYYGPTSDTNSAIISELRKYKSITDNSLSIVEEYKESWETSDSIPEYSGRYAIAPIFVIKK